MTAAKLNITIEQGADFLQSYLIEDASGAALDLTACTASMQIREYIGSCDAVISLTTENGGLEIDGPGGVISVVINDADTAAIPAGPYVYDMKLVDSGGKTIRLLQGSLTVAGEVTFI